MTRDDAINELKCAIDLIKQDGKDWLDERDIPLLQMAIEALDHKHGEWIKFDEGDCYCSNCGIALEDWVQGIFYKFCPYCGADMRESND